MALAFNKAKGKAQKGVDAYTYKDGEQTVRIVGGILPMYVYWVKGTGGKDLPIECLSFDRELEKFTNITKDHVPAYFADKKCSWAYRANALVTVDGVQKVTVLNLKKKMYEQIVSAAENLGDPTDVDTGWDIVFKKAKTGPLPFNVEYTLNTFKCKNRALTPEERALVDAAVNIDEKFIRPTPDEIKALLEKITSGEDEAPEGADDAAKEAVNELNQ